MITMNDIARQDIKTEDGPTLEGLKKLLKEKDDCMQKLFLELKDAKTNIRIRDREIDQLRSVLIQKNEYIDNNFREVPIERSKKYGILGERLELDKFFENPSQIIEKDEITKKLIKDALLRNEFLRRLDISQIDDIIKYMHRVSFEANSYIIEEGMEGDAFYVSLDGIFEVWKDKSLLGTMEAGRAFGELALLYNCKRTASVRAKSQCKTWKLDRKTFQYIMFTSNDRKQKEIISFLKTIPALKEISSKKMSKLADVVEEIHYQSGEYIIRENEVGNAFFIIKSGSVRVSQTNKDGVEEHVRNMTIGEWFGEKALYTLERRSANIIATSRVELLSLDRNNFIYLIGNLSEIRKKNYSIVNSLKNGCPTGSYDDIGKQVTGDNDTKSLSQGSMKNSDDDLLLPQGVTTELKSIQPGINVNTQLSELDDWINSIQLDQLRTVGILGIGGFGRVELVQYKPNEDHVFALKCMKKDHIVRTKQQQHIIAERDIMLDIKCNFVCRLGNRVLWEFSPEIIEKTNEENFSHLRIHQLLKNLLEKSQDTLLLMKIGKDTRLLSRKRNASESRRQQSTRKKNRKKATTNTKPIVCCLEIAPKRA